MNDDKYKSLRIAERANDWANEKRKKYMKSHQLIESNGRKKDVNWIGGAIIKCKSIWQPPPPPLPQQLLLLPMLQAAEKLCIRMETARWIDFLIRLLWRLNSNRIEFYCWLKYGWMAPGEIETAAAAAAINMIIKCEKLDVAIECAIVLLFEVNSWPTQSRLHSSHSRATNQSQLTLFEHCKCHGSCQFVSIATIHYLPNE